MGREAERCFRAMCATLYSRCCRPCPRPRPVPPLPAPPSVAGRAAIRDDLGD